MADEIERCGIPASFFVFGGTYMTEECECMSRISVEGLTFCYDGGYETIFEDVSFAIDTDWKLGLIGRNGRGKTTF